MSQLVISEMIEYFKEDIPGINHDAILHDIGRVNFIIANHHDYEKIDHTYL